MLTHHPLSRAPTGTSRCPRRPPWTALTDAPGIAARLLGTDSVRYQHTAGVARAANRARGAAPPSDAPILLAAAWLHDIGYAGTLTDTGFHPLDGARYLHRIGAPVRLCRLVAHHTAAQVEAAERGLVHELMTEFPPEHSPTADALTYADLTTAPDGAPVSADHRITEILTRYPPDHPVHHAIQMATPLLLVTAARVDQRLADRRSRRALRGHSCAPG